MGLAKIIWIDFAICMPASESDGFGDVSATY
jgi:hypothetical protein